MGKTWTPEPWKAGRTDMQSYLGDGRPVHYIYRSENESAETRIRVLENPDSGADPTDDALRIVACVNACSSMPDPAGEIARLKRIEEAAGVFANYYRNLGETEHTNRVFRGLDEALGEEVGGG